MPKQSVFIATSLDGFIARSNGDIEWLTQVDPISGEDYGYKEFIATVDALVMGRHTFEKVKRFDKWPYDLPVTVLSSRSLEIPEKFREHVSKCRAHQLRLLIGCRPKVMSIYILTGEKQFNNFYVPDTSRR